jgi:hypothetical protein
MGYYVKALLWKKSNPKWKVQFVSYRKDHFESLINSNAKKPRKTWDVSKERWRSLGFYKAMTLDEARARAKQLNIKEHLKRQELSLIKKQDIEKKSQDKFQMKMPMEFLIEFEKRFISRTFLSEDRRANINRVRLRWRAAQKLIMSIDSDPWDWYYNMYDFYDYFYEKQLSIRYMNEIMKFANLWGFFICKKMGRPFLPVPKPGGYERRRIIDSYFEKTKDRPKKSGPITLLMLLKSKAKLRDNLYNWIYLTVWFGLRPKEVDNLHDVSMWKVETLFNGRKVLWVYQTKIVALPEVDRWKPIPILYSEQEVGLKILEEGVFKRPLVKTVREHFGKDISLYGGRKGFTDLMLSKGNSLESISIWMGHSTIGRTWKSYKNRRKYHIQYGA